MDSDGVDVRVLAAAMNAGSYRGVPRIHLAHPTIALCTFAHEGEARSESRLGTSMLVMDGRVDAVLRGAAQVPESDQASFLHRALLAGEPSSLNDFAAEVAVGLVPEPADELLLARDPFGLRPLFIARAGRRFAFSSDAGILMKLGVASDELDPDVVSAWLARRFPLDGRTAFRSIREVLPGGWIRVDLQGRYWEGRWFDPGRLDGPRLGGVDATDAVREAVTDAVRARSGRGRVAISLSGGRDSAAVAIAAARAGIDATGLTYAFDTDLPIDETPLARQVCSQLGIPWASAPVTSRPARERLDEVPRWSGTPLAYGPFPEGTAMADAAAEGGFDVVLNGEGGEPFFGSSEICVLDFARTGHLAAATRAARRFKEDWDRSYLRLAKVTARAMAPRALVRQRERRRTSPPWVRGRIPDALIDAFVPRSDRQARMQALATRHASAYDLEERIYQWRRVEPAYPLLDLRVVGVAMRLRLEHRSPVRRFKPILASAFLGELEGSRVKMSFMPYYDKLARNVQSSFPELFTADGLAADQGFLLPAGLSAIRDDRWRIDSLRVAVLETWLRRSI
jgi:asparagine synthetase B (glutamine-hydrolysing)